MHQTVDASSRTEHHIINGINNICNETNEMPDSPNLSPSQKRGIGRYELLHAVSSRLTYIYSPPQIPTHDVNCNKNDKLPDGRGEKKQQQAN